LPEEAGDVPIRQSLEQKILIAALSFVLVGTIAMQFMPDARCTDGLLCGKAIHHGGHAYLTYVMVPFATPDDMNGRTSTVQIYEDGKPLGPPHSDVQDIIENGRGRFLYWRTGKTVMLFFSASDNGDPNTNGRKYTISDPNVVNPNPRQQTP
jgi:hypothetical protein